MANVFHRWASLGLYVPGEIDPYQDPEALLMDTLRQVHTDGRLLGMMTTWVAFYGHLLLTKKLKFSAHREKRIFSAIIQASKTQEAKLIRLVKKGRARKHVFLFENEVPVLKQLAQKDPNPYLLRHGFIVKNGPLNREKIVLPPGGTYKRSAILRNRALYGPSLRSDLATILPMIQKISVRQLAKRLHVAPQSLQPVVEEYVRSGLVEWSRKGRASLLRWTSKVKPQEAA